MLVVDGDRLKMNLLPLVTSLQTERGSERGVQWVELLLLGGTPALALASNVISVKIGCIVHEHQSHAE